MHPLQRTRLSREGLLNCSTTDIEGQIILCSMCGVYVGLGGKTALVENYCSRDNHIHGQP